MAPVARLNAGNLLSVLGTPFDGRAAGPSALRVLATIGLVVALVMLVRRGARAASPKAAPAIRTAPTNNATPSTESSVPNQGAIGRRVSASELTGTTTLPPPLAPSTATSTL